MCATLQLILLGVVSNVVLCQYIAHPLAGLSYFTNSNFQPAVAYSYVAPTGQTVNVKFATGALVQSSPRPQISATPNSFRAPQSVFNSVSSTPLPLSVTINMNTQGQFTSFQDTQTQASIFGQDLLSGIPVRPAGPPRPESLFVLATGLEPVASQKQIQAYNDFVRQLANETSVTISTQSPVVSSTDFDLDLESYFNIDFGEKGFGEKI